MAKKGCISICKNNYLKVVYAHRNAQLDVLGKKVVKMCTTLGVDGLNELYDKIILVDEDAPMTPEQIQAYKKYMPEQLWKEDLDWSTAIGYTKDATKPLMDGFPYVVDYAGFLPSWRNRFRYLIDLDRNVLQVTKGGLEVISAPEEVFFSSENYVDKICPCVVGTFPLDNIPADWLEQCDAFWGTVMLEAKPYADDELARDSNVFESDPDGQHDYHKMRFFLGR
ncbi:hypothetical protein LJC42_04580 [Eubacteriales bacterium OttesenSCG-928-K08]|nr:hypothetical protein [Eubacteriales bacterium OttesenSCG-928-K08]